MPPDSEIKLVLDSFSDGVTQWNRAFREGKVQMPDTLLGYQPEHFTDWTPVDSIALAKLQTMELSYDADADISRTEKVEKVRAVFDAGSSDPLAKKRAGLLLDVFRFAPPDPATPLSAFPDDAPSAYRRWSSPSAKNMHSGLLGYGIKSVKTPPTPSVSLAAIERAGPFVGALERIRNLFTGDEFFGSNNWAVSGTKTASGYAMVASDPHLSLSSPMTFWPTQLVVQADAASAPELEVIGIQFPGFRAWCWAPIAPWAGARRPRDTT